MTSGRPFSDREIEFIKEHMNEKYPSVLARHLGIHYADDNGGFRSKKSVASLIRRLTEPPQPKRRQAIQQKP